jgi:hypothetical protein
MNVNRVKTFWLPILLAGVLLPAAGFAQYYDSPGLGQKPVTQHPQDYKPLGIRAGGFMLHPGVQLAAEYTDNAFYNDIVKESDTIFHIRPYLNAQSTWSRHSLNIRLAADIARYADYDFRDYEDYFLQVSGKLDVRNRSYFSYSLDYMNLHEGLNTRDSEQGFEPTRYDLYGFGVGYDHTFNRLSLGARYSWQRVDFEDALSFDGDVIDNQDRDRTSHNLSFSAAYQFQTYTQAFISYSYGTTEFDQEFDRNGYDRAGDSSSVNIGLSRALSGKLDASVFGSYHWRTYNDPLLPDTEGWAGGASLNWQATALTSVTGSISSSIEDTTSQYASGYLRTLYQVRVDHELMRFVQLNGFVAYSDSEYQLIDGAPEDARSNDQIFRAGIGINWFINRFMFLGAAYDYEKLKSNVPGDGFEVNRVWLTLGIER